MRHYFPPHSLGRVKIIAYLWHAISANLSECISIMAKARVSTNPLYTGGAGGYSFYVRQSEQIVRQRKNNSNYGADASRTYSQMERRVRWSNLVNLYKVIKSWQPKAYETKSKGQTDYNIFMSLNINRDTVSLTKELALQGCSVVAGYVVSRGSLPPIQTIQAPVFDGRCYNIKLSQAISASTTVGQFSADVIANNVDFQAGDNIAFPLFYNYKSVPGNMPYSRCEYTEVTLNPSSSVLLSGFVGERFSKGYNDYLAVAFGASGSQEVGACLIHTRKVAGSLQVSTQSLAISAEAFYEEFNNIPWIQECIDSYGMQGEVPLDPSFSGASISAVTANGSAIENGYILVGNQSLRIYGTNLMDPSLKLMAGDVQYYPLDRGDGYIEFLLGNNGTYTITLRDMTYMTFSVEEVVVPSGLPSYLRMQQQHSSSDNVNTMTLNEAYCINYPYLYDENHEKYRLTIGNASHPFTDGESANWSGENCTLQVLHDEGSPATRVVAQLTDTTKPAYMMYQGFIVAVFNYSN